MEFLPFTNFSSFVIVWKVFWKNNLYAAVRGKKKALFGLLTIVKAKTRKVLTVCSLTVN